MNKFTQTIILIILCLLLVVITITIPVKAEWNQIYSQKVHPQQNISINGINITNIQFTVPTTAHYNSKEKLILDSPVIPMMLLDISINNKHQLKPFEEGNFYQDNESEFLFVVFGFTAPDSLLWEYSQYNPSATLKIYNWHQDYPNIEIHIHPEYTSIEYGKYDSMNVDVDIISHGISTSIDITPDFYPLTDLNNRSEKHLNISAGKTQTLKYNINLKNPGNYILKITASVPDFVITHPNGKQETKTFYFLQNTSIQILHPKTNIVVEKILQTRLYTCKNTSASITISNNGIFDIKNITIKDEVLDSFTSNNKIFIWNVPSLKSGNQLTFYERIIPITVGSYTTKAATISYSIQNTQYTNISNIQEIQIISTGKECSAFSATIMNVSEEYVNENIVPVKTIPITFDDPSRYNSTTARQIPQTTPIIPTTIPGFEFIVVIFGIFAAYKRTKL